VSFFGAFLSSFRGFFWPIWLRTQINRLIGYFS
jgi:hypothetical protein